MSQKAKRRLRQCPQRCGGGLAQTINVWNRPQFSCGKCGHTFTCGKDGGEYAAAVPMADTTDPISRSGRTNSSNGKDSLGGEG